MIEHGNGNQPEVAKRRRPDVKLDGISRFSTGLVLGAVLGVGAAIIWGQSLKGERINSRPNGDIEKGRNGKGRTGMLQDLVRKS